MRRLAKTRTAATGTVSGFHRYGCATSAESAAILGHNSKARKPLKRKVNVGLGFVTGRKSFKSVLRTYVDSWNESRQSAPARDVALHLFVAYDLTYSNTEVADYTVTDDKVVRAVASAHYITGSSIRTEAQGLVKRKILTSKEAKLLFGGQGYGAKRNAILYLAVKDNLDLSLIHI